MPCDAMPCEATGLRPCSPEDHWGSRQSAVSSHSCQSYAAMDWRLQLIARSVLDPTSLLLLLLLLNVESCIDCFEEVAK